MEHTIKYAQNTKEVWLWKAECSCGWIECKKREDLLEAVDRHIRGTEWVEADPHAPDLQAAE